MYPKKRGLPNRVPICIDCWTPDSDATPGATCVHCGGTVHLYERRPLAAELEWARHE